MIVMTGQRSGGTGEHWLCPWLPFAIVKVA
jgi:hypothetical protein